MLVLLSLAVVLTLVLFILSRSVTDILVSSKGEEAARAFSAAEAGIEQALVIGSGGANPQLGNNAGYVSSVSDFASNQQTYNYPNEMSAGDSSTVWFVNHDKTTGAALCDGTHPCFKGSSMQVCWGKSGTSGTSATTPAVEVSVFYESTPGDLSTIKIARGAYDPFAGRGQNPPNSFSGVDAGPCPVGTYPFQKTIQFNTLGIPAGSYNTENGLQFARVRIFYNTDMTQTVAFNFPGNNTLPSQGLSIISTGTAGQSSRRLEVFQGWPEPPSIFDTVIYSASGLTK